jgi:hypothetical protein
MSKEPLPPIADEMKQAAKHRLNVNLPPRTDLADAAVEAQARALGEKWGSVTHITQKEAPRPTAPLTSVRFDCPDYLDKALSVRAAEENVTKTYLILRALKTAGYRVEDVDLVKDRRRLRR